MKKIMGFILLALVLSSCSKVAEKSSLVCKDNNDDIQTEMVLSGRGDIADSTQSKTKAPIDILTIAYQTDEAGLFELLAGIDASYNEAKGVSYSYSIKDGFLLEDISVDYTIADFKVLAELGLIDNEGESSHVSLKVTKDLFESTGGTCQLN